jgi:glycosyltransferase involved in cell wall biosynthesis
MLVSPAEKIALQEVSMRGRCCTDGAPKESPAFAPGVIWEGVFTGWSGYAKANREVMLRVANSLYVQLRHAIKPSWDNEAFDLRFLAHERTRVASSCPFLRFFGPDTVDLPENRRRIIWTMMETESVHHDMVGQINTRYHELWTPSQWNAGTFRASGVTLPIYVVPLGVNQLIYRPIEGAELPPCILLSRGGKGVREIPKGYIFISVGLPSFRKGFDILASAFEEAFGGADDVALVLAVTHCLSNVESLSLCRSMKSRIYALEGSFDEHQMARIYSASSAYVTCSRGEGWNLPVCEAAACGLPVIAPRNTTHEEVLGKDAFLFDPEGYAVIPGTESVSLWYNGMKFSVFGRKSKAALIELLRHVRKNGSDVRSRAKSLKERMRSKMTWDHSASIATKRLLEMQE